MWRRFTRVKTASAAGSSYGLHDEYQYFSTLPNRRHVHVAISPSGALRSVWNTCEGIAGAIRGSTRYLARCHRTGNNCRHRCCCTAPATTCLHRIIRQASSAASDGLMEPAATLAIRDGGQRPRIIAPDVVSLRQGDAVVFAVQHRPVTEHAVYRVNHATGEPAAIRRTLIGIIFRDALAACGALPGGSILSRETVWRATRIERRIGGVRTTLEEQREIWLEALRGCNGKDRRSKRRFMSSVDTCRKFMAARSGPFRRS